MAVLNEIVSYTESERAAQMAAAGQKVIERDGVFFKELASGFFAPVNLLAIRERVIRRVPGTLGHKMVVADPRHANGYLNIMVVQDIPSYDLKLFKKKRRWELRKSLECVEVHWLEDPAVLLTQRAHDVDVSFRERTEWGERRSEADFEANMKRLMRDEGLRWFGGYIDGKLAGYAVLMVVCRNGCIGHIATHTDHLSTGINGALLYEICRRCRESGVVDQIYFGLWSTKSSLNRFKERMLFKRRDLPAYVHLRWPVNWGLRLLRPLAYRRVVGFSPDQFEKGGGGACLEGSPS
jgi:hypothetical protein